MDSAKVEIGKAIFAAGCFWGVEQFFRNVKGITRTVAGYTGGHTQHPTYREVCSGNTGHAEAVQIFFDLSKTSFEALARLFFEIHNPSLNYNASGKRSQYRSAVFYQSDEQKEVAEKLAERLRGKGIDVCTEIKPAGIFYEAEACHQNYYARLGKTQAVRHCTSRFKYC